MSQNHINAAFSLIENDESKVLGLTIGKHENVSPGTRLPRKGMYRFWLQQNLRDLSRRV